MGMPLNVGVWTSGQNKMWSMLYRRQRKKEWLLGMKILVESMNDY